MNTAKVSRTAEFRSIFRSARDTLRGRLPLRYDFPIEARFQTLALSGLRPGIRVLDVGSGRRPTIPPSARPAGIHYAGLDISDSELSKAPPGSYDQLFIGDVARPISTIKQEFDLMLTWYVLEHVKPLDTAFENMRGYLRPGGRLVAAFSGTFSVFALINRVVPESAARWILQHLHGRPPETTFPAHYHHCWYSALERIMSRWKQYEILPYYTGAGYFRFSRELQALYIGYEEWITERAFRNLACHYLVDAIA